MWCSEYCRGVAELVRYRRRVERDRRHIGPSGGDAVLTALWRKESDLLIGEFYQPHLTPRQREDVFKTKGRHCLICGKPATDIDHVVPGAGDAAKNLQPLCATCHLEKTADQGGRYKPIPNKVVATSDAQLRQVLGEQLLDRAKNSGIGVFALTSKLHIARYASYLARVYAAPPRPCDDEATWGELQRQLRKARRDEMAW